MSKFRRNLRPVLGALLFVFAACIMANAETFSRMSSGLMEFVDSSTNEILLRFTTTGVVMDEDVTLGSAASDTITINGTVAGAPAFTAITASTYNTAPAATRLSISTTVLEATGTNANIGITLTPKGSGDVSFTGTDSALTAAGGLTVATAQATRVTDGTAFLQSGAASITLATSSNATAGAGANLSLLNTAADVTGQRYMIRADYTDNADADADFILLTHNAGATTAFAVASDGATTIGGSASVATSLDVDGACNLGDTTAGSNVAIGNSTGDATFLSDNFDFSCTDATDNVFQVYNATGTVLYIDLDLGTDALFLGNNAGTLALASAAWDIDATGAASGLASVTSPIFSSGAADVADAGSVRLGNAQNIAWEADPAAGDYTLGVDASEILQASGAATVAGALVGNGAWTIGDGGDDVAINSNDWDIDGAGAVTGLTGITRAMQAQKTSEVFGIPFAWVRNATGGGALTGAAGAPTAADHGMTISASTGAALMFGAPSDTETETQTATITVPLPPNYVADASVVVRVYARCDNADATTATLDVVLFESDKNGAAGADLVTTAAQSIDTVTWAALDFTVTDTTLAPGDLLVIGIITAVVDPGGGGTPRAEIGSIELLLTTQD